MPIYEFQCAAHGVFEEILPFAASDDPAPCPSCAASCERIVSLPAIAQGNFGTVPRSVSGARRKSPRSAYKMERYVDERLSGKHKGGPLQEAIRRTGHAPSTDRPESLGLKNVGDS